MPTSLAQKVRGRITALAGLLFLLSSLASPNLAQAASIVQYGSACCGGPVPLPACCPSGSGEAAACISQSCGPTEEDQAGTCQRVCVNADDEETTCDSGGEIKCLRGESSEEASDGVSIPRAPSLSIDIPTIRLSDAVAAGGQFIDIPWLADYIAGAFRFALPAAAVIAIVIMMVGGLQWTMSAGDAGKIGQARKRIVDAAIGLSLIVGSYAVLSVINPDLVSLHALRIETVVGDPFAVPNSSHEDADPELLARLAADLQHPAVPADLVDVRVDGMAVSLANPAIVPHLQAAAAAFVNLRTSSSWTIRGQCYRSPSTSVAMYIKRCLFLSSCTIPTGSVGLTRNGAVIRSGGRMIPADPRFQNMTRTQLVHETNSAHVREWGPMAQALYQHLNEQAQATGGGHASALACDIWCQTDRVSRFAAVDVPCQLILERAMKQAGWGRLNVEYWHFEHPDTSTTRSVSVGFQVGSYAPFSGSRCVDESVKRKPIDYGRYCPDGVMGRGLNPCHFTCDGRPMTLPDFSQYCQTHANDCAG